MLMLTLNLHLVFGLGRGRVRKLVPDPDPVHNPDPTYSGWVQLGFSWETGQETGLLSKYLIIIN